MGLILVQAHELGIDANFYHIGVEGPDLVGTAGDLAEGIFYPYSYDNQSASPEVQTFYEKYVQRFGTEPDTIAANAYDAAYLLSNCFEKVGDTVESVKRCLYETENFEGASGIYGFDEHGDAVKEIFIKTIKDGEFVRYEE
jgi:branched-chain amino acid transport system substrate-binding protein